MGCRRPTIGPDGAPTRAAQAAQAGDPGTAADGGASRLAATTGTTRPSATRPAVPRPITTTAVRYSSATPWRPVIPTPTPGPALLQMTLVDAEATVMSWTIPGQAPRIERSGYVGAVEAFEALEAAGTEMVFAGGESSLRWQIAEGGTSEREQPGGPLVLVEISQRGLDLVDPGWETMEDRFSSCTLVPAHERYTVTHVFDPRIGALAGYGHARLLDELWTVASPAIDHVRITTTPTSTAPPTSSPDAYASPTATLTPSPTPAPLIDASASVRSLGIGEHPAALAGAVAAWPLVVGSSWTYRATEHLDGVFWSTWTITESVVSAVQHGEALMEVELARVTDRADDLGHGLWPEVDLDRLLVRHDAVLYVIQRSNRSLSPAQADAELPPARSQAWEDGGLVAVVGFPIGADYEEAQAQGEGKSWWRPFWRPIGPFGDVKSSAGVFPSCHASSSRSGAANGVQHWLCIGVGYVRHEVSGCHPMFGGYTVFDLIDFTVPQLVPLQ